MERTVVEGFLVEASRTSYGRAAAQRPSSSPASPVASPPPTSSSAAVDSSDVDSDNDAVITALHEYDADLCDVCGGGESCDDDAMLACEGCGVWVHQTCYGVAAVPEQDWCVFSVSLVCYPGSHAPQSLQVL